MTYKLGLIGCLALAGCGSLPFPVLSPRQIDPGAMSPVAGESTAGIQVQTRPRARPLGIGRKPPEGARTAEALDTSTVEERVAAANPSEPESERALGSTVVSLGDVTRQGFWLETPLVSEATMGRVLFPATGKSAQVALIPIDGPRTGGSRISLAAMRLIEAPLTDLPTLEVFVSG